MAFQMNDMTKPVKDRLGFDPASVKKLTFGELIKKIGPGIILTGIVIGPGNITTSAMMGANYGYKMLWLLIPIILMGITFTLSSYRISIMTGLPILHAIRHHARQYHGYRRRHEPDLRVRLEDRFSDHAGDPRLLLSDQGRLFQGRERHHDLYLRHDHRVLRNADRYRRPELGPGRTWSHTSDAA